MLAIVVKLPSSECEMRCAMSGCVSKHTLFVIWHIGPMYVVLQFVDFVVEELLYRIPIDEVLNENELPLLSILLIQLFQSLLLDCADLIDRCIELLRLLVCKHVKPTL